MRRACPPSVLRKRSRYFQGKAFSLIEVSLALAVIAFVITAIVGLLSQMAKVARDSVDETVITAMIGNTTDDLRSRPFDEIPCDHPQSGFPSSVVHYFYEDGTLCNEDSDSSALEKKAVYRCEITGTADPETIIAPDVVNLITLHLDLKWPLGTSNPKSRAVHCDLARY